MCSIPAENVDITPFVAVLVANGVFICYTIYPRLHRLHSHHTGAFPHLSKYILSSNIFHFRIHIRHRNHYIIHTHNQLRNTLQNLYRKFTIIFLSMDYNYIIINLHNPRKILPTLTIFSGDITVYNIKYLSYLYFFNSAPFSIRLQFSLFIVSAYFNIISLPAL